MDTDSILILQEMILALRMVDITFQNAFDPPWHVRTNPPAGYGHFGVGLSKKAMKQLSRILERQIRNRKLWYTSDIHITVHSSYIAFSTCHTDTLFWLLRFHQRLRHTQFAISGHQYLDRLEEHFSDCFT